MALDLHILVSLDVLFQAHNKRHVNIFGDAVVVGETVFYPRIGAEGLAGALSTIRGLGVRVYLTSPFDDAETKALIRPVQKMLGSNRLKLLEPVFVQDGQAPASGDDLHDRQQKLERELDAALVGELSRTDVSVSRLLVIDGRSVKDGLLAKNRLRLRSDDERAILRHLKRLGSLRGDLRSKDLTFHWEDYDARGRAHLLSRARGLDLPLEGQARHPEESLLLLDLDGTLVDTDDRPIDHEARKRYDSYNQLLLGLPKAPISAAEERPHDYILSSGTHGGWARPGLRGLMETAHSTFDRVAIYTAAGEDYARDVLSKILPSDLQPDFVLHRGLCFQRGLKSLPEKSVMTAVALGYSERRVVAVDDNPQAWLYSRKNVIPINPYYGNHDTQGLDGALHDLAYQVWACRGKKDLRAAIAKKKKAR